MKTFVSLAVLLSVVAMLFSAVPATATTIDECQAQIAVLGDQTVATDFLGKKPEKAEAKLVADLAAASDALNRAKLDKAINKMMDYEKDAAELVKKGQLADAAALTQGAEDVIACIGAIQ